MNDTKCTNQGGLNLGSEFPRDSSIYLESSVDLADFGPSIVHCPPEPCSDDQGLHGLLYHFRL